MSYTYLFGWVKAIVFIHELHTIKKNKSTIINLKARQIFQLNKMTLEEVIQTIEESKKVKDFCIERSRFSPEFEISSIEFLKFTENDLNSELEHKFVNALSNAKRAIDSQIAGLLMLYGFYKLAKKEFWGFPKKLECLSFIGIITPGILGKLNKLRNLMEHEFITPNDEKVKDFVDVTSLFIQSTDRYLMNYLSVLEIDLENPTRAVLFQLFPNEGIGVNIMDFNGYDPAKEEGGNDYIKTYTYKDEGYKEIAKAFHELSEINPFPG